MRVTIKTIAEKCGVAPITVSRVIAQSQNVSEKTRNMVLKAIYELGYWQKDIEAPVLSDSPQIAALMVEDITQNSRYILQSAADYLKANGCLSIICETGLKARNLQEYVSTMSNIHSVKGAIVISSRGSRVELAKIAEEYPNFPIVATHWCSAWSKVDSVILDSYHSAVCAVDYLVAHGHQHIALLNSPKESSGAYEEREGYLDTMRKHGLEADEKYILPTDLHRSDGAKLIHKIMRTMPEVTAVLTANLEMAQGMLPELKNMGKRVPEDISVIPFTIDNAADGMHNFTTVGANYLDAGIAAAQILMERMREQTQPNKPIKTVKKVVLEPQVFEGGTVLDLSQHA